MFIREATEELADERVSDVVRSAETKYHGRAAVFGTD